MFPCLQSLPCGHVHWTEFPFRSYIDVFCLFYPLATSFGCWNAPMIPVVAMRQCSLDRVSFSRLYWCFLPILPLATSFGCWNAPMTLVVAMRPCSLDRVSLSELYWCFPLILFPSYILWLLECSHDSNCCHAAMFFGQSFPFRVILMFSVYFTPSYILWLLECSHDSSRCHAAMFFGQSFPFRVILEQFDKQDGLRRLLNTVGLLNS